MSSEARGVVEGLGDVVDEVTVKAVDASNEGALATLAQLPMGRALNAVIGICPANDRGVEAPVALRPLRAGEQGLLQRATLGNMNWCGERFTMGDVMSRPEFSHYTRIDPERGDFGVVAERGDVIAGVCWAQFLPASDRGYGFVDEATPEVSLWVEPGSRGRGHGRRLMEALIASARTAGPRRISLSVECDNHARGLYGSLGFVAVAGRESDGVMLLEL